MEELIIKQGWESLQLSKPNDKYIGIKIENYFEDDGFEEEGWEFAEIAIDKDETKQVIDYLIQKIEYEKDILFNFFMWFRENGEKFMTTKTDISVEGMIQIYLKSKSIL